MTLQDQLQAALKTVKYPGFTRDIVSFGLVKEATAADGVANVLIQLTSNSPEAAQAIRERVEEVVRQLPGIEKFNLDVRLPAASAAPRAAAQGGPWSAQNRVPGVRRVIAVASGKGGVGKSTVSVNLACAFQRLGMSTGLLDCDIYGPSVPLMMGSRERPGITSDERLVPPLSHGVKLMSIGFLLDDDQPVIWRGPMIVKTIQQFLMQTDWGDLDLLLVDLPPGTGDAQLTLCQSVPLDGGVVVTTPQEAALGVVRKGIAMFRKLNVPVLGIVENMSYYTTPEGTRVEIFGHGGGSGEASRQGVPFLGEIPIFPEIRVGGDTGVPVVVSAPETAPAKSFIDVAQTLKSGMKQ